MTVSMIISWDEATPPITILQRTSPVVMKHPSWFLLAQLGKHMRSDILHLLTLLLGFGPVFTVGLAFAFALMCKGW